ncbi:MAG: glycoside-pentoside-hexuronide (GPH):cation symporter [Chloroflexi bacterium]|nr:glycoside-pentoside-hexuronide (GPH):cation symporter [Chloroflexota bacterium]
MAISDGKLSRRTKLMYGVGDMGINLADTMVSLLFAIFLTDVVGLRPALAAVAVFIGRTMDYINDPIIGYLSDRTRSRWGRRRPFILFGLLPFLLAYTLLWWIPPFSSQIGLAIYYGFAFILYDTAATVIYMPYFALTPELTQNYDERTTLTSYRMAFSILGGMIGFVVPLAIIGTMDPENASKVMAVGAGIGLVSILPLLLVFFGTHERVEAQVQTRPSFGKSFLAAVKNKPFVFSLLIFTFTWMALDILQSTLLYFLKYRMHIAEQGDLIFGLFYVAALVSIPFWEWAARRWNKQRAYIAGMVFLALVTIGMGLARPEWGVNGMLVFGFLAGFGLGAVQILTWAMIPDGVEVDELETGQRHEGMFYSLVVTIRKIAASVSLPLILLVLDWTGYNPSLEVQPTRAIQGIQALIGPIPSVFLLIGIIFALFYPLTRERHAQVLSELANRKKGRNN